MSVVEFHFHMKLTAHFFIIFIEFPLLKYFQSAFMKALTLLLLLGTTQMAFAQYKIYADRTNLFNQQVIKTNDGGLLLYAEEDCYTPGSIAIEGCMYAIFLVKTDAQGDTLWTSSVPFYGWNSHLFENVDGSWTMFSLTPGTYQCENIGVGLWGFYSILITTLDDHGKFVRQVEFPDECELALRDVVRVSDKQYALLAVFSKPIYWPIEAEGRLMIIDTAGVISKQVTLPGRNWEAGRLFFNGTDALQILSVDTFHFANLTSFNLNLQETSHLTGDVELGNCVQGFDNRNRWQILKNGDLLLTCSNHVGNDWTFTMWRLDPLLQVLSTTTSPFYSPSNLLETQDGHLITTSATKDSFPDLNTQIQYLDAQGNLLSTEHIIYTGDERPEMILETVPGKFVITGNINCCNYDTLIGPGKSFLTFGEYQLSALTEPESQSGWKVSPTLVSNSITISNPLEEFIPKNHVFVLYDLSGRFIMKFALPDKINEVIMESFAPGMYIYHVLYKNQLLTAGKLVKQ